MKNNMLQEWRSMEAEELLKQLKNLLEQQFKLKMQHAVGDLKELHLLKNIRKNIARIMGILRERGI